jgi:Endoglucanase
MKMLFQTKNVRILVTAMGFLFSVICNAENLPSKTQYRGAMIQPISFVKNNSVQVFGEIWNANLVRWQLNFGFPNGPADTASLKTYFNWLDGQLERFDNMLPSLRQYGLKVCLDLHTPPGGRTGWTMNVFRDTYWQDAFVEVWEYIVNRYKDEQLIWGYDLLNEPNEGNRQEIPAGVSDWRGLGLRTAKAIRKIDPDTSIVFESYLYGLPGGFKEFTVFDPEEIPNVVYSAHMYIPHIFTHQRENKDTTSYSYPGMIPPEQWDTNQVYFDKEALRKELAPIIKLQQEQGAKIFIGEFGAVRFAPNNSTYCFMKDLIELFEEYGWDWAYHAFREWHAWNVELDPSILSWTDKVAEKPTDVELFIRDYFARNRK